MRKIIAWLLLVLGAFLLTAAVVAVVWAGDAAKKTPLDTNQETRLSGTALVPTKAENTLGVKASNFNRADADKSDDDTIVFVANSCLVLDSTPSACGEPGEGEDADPNVITVSEPDIFAVDRTTGEAISDEDELPEEAVPHEGLVNKFPFDTEQKTYDFWDGVLGEAVPAEYQGTKDIDGLETYVFNYTVTDEPATVIGDIEGLYSMDKTMYVDPRTGSIVDQEQQDVRTTEDGETLLDLSLSITDEEVQEKVDDAKDSIETLDLLTETVPLVGFIGGPILIILGALLLLTGRRSRTDEA